MAARTATAPVTVVGTRPEDGLLVASELLLDGRELACPAAPLLAGELRRRGVPTATATLKLAGDSQVEASFATVSSGDFELGLAVAAAGADRAVADSVVQTWLSLAGPRTVLLASPRSFCAGVERAIEIVLRTIERRSTQVYVRKQIVHNTHVVKDLERRGARFVDELDEVPDGATVVFSAHGVSPAVRDEAERRGMEVIDGTCPLVTKVHAEARRFAGRGDTVVMVGHAEHEEVEGTMGEAPGSMVLVADVDDVLALELEEVSRVSYLTQTTLAVDETAEVIDALRDKFPALREPGSDDICYATTNRQDAVRQIIAESELVLVVGSANSSNSVRLVELCRRQDAEAHLIEDVSHIRPEWLTGVKTVGLTAGASAPPELVYEVIAALGGLGQVAVLEREAARETIQFGLPATLRSSS
ncbi:4-hydroxy-3-methylbut-2-enyl diphosphate reductase [Amycolatopsis sp. NPDC088138]|uniref:4-hydroxy-3-methylbut-2-enyl diphosphate reductase n=1 Tax=Amycolatopsis sp. NPDC088138 TaxID=3363938 RepID=UPI00381569E4